MIHEFDKYPEYISIIQSLPEKQLYSKRDLLIKDLRMYRDLNGSGVEIYYVPFNYYEENAKISLVGITPGWTQMELAVRTFREGLVAEKSWQDICLELEEKASFAGAMRNNLIKMLDELGIKDFIGPQLGRRCSPGSVNLGDIDPARA